MLLAVVALTAISPFAEAYQHRGAKREGFTLAPISATRVDLRARRMSQCVGMFQAERRTRQTFSKSGRDVGLDIAFFRNQTNDTKAIT